jgi:CO/xanthine dehydrogenase FAD-binding subunit
MRAFTYERVETPAEAVAAVARTPGAKFIAGDTNLRDLMKPEIETVILDNDDEHVNHLAMKGIGEHGVCGSGAPVSNAVFNATGIRVRDVPSTMAKLLPGLPAQV